MEYEEEYEDYSEPAEDGTIIGEDGEVYEVVDEDDETAARIAAIENHLMAQAQAEQDGYYEEPEEYDEEPIPSPDHPGYAYDLDAMASRFLAVEHEMGRELSNGEIEQLLDYTVATEADPTELIEYIDHDDKDNRRDWMVDKMREGAN